MISRIMVLDLIHECVCVYVSVFVCGPRYTQQAARPSSHDALQINKNLVDKDKKILDDSYLRRSSSETSPNKSANCFS